MDGWIDGWNQCCKSHGAHQNLDEIVFDVKLIGLFFNLREIIPLFFLREAQTLIQFQRYHQYIIACSYSYIHIYAQHRNIYTKWQVLFDIWTLEKVKAEYDLQNGLGESALLLIILDQ